MGAPPGLTTQLRGSRELIPGLLAVAVFFAWAASEGGYPSTSLYPGALFLLGLLVVTVVGYRAEIRDLSQPSAVALAFLAAFTLWSFVAIMWADDKALAWEGADRTMVYLTIFALFVLPRWRPSSAAIVLGAYSLGLAVVGAVIVLGLSASSHPELSFINDRLAEPTGYTNANAALFAAASFPALFLASRREVPWPARGLSLAAAGFLVQFALIPQSRGALIVYPIALLLYLAFVPRRVRTVLVVAPAAVATALAVPAVLNVFGAAGGDGGVAAAIDGAARAMAVSAVALFVIGAALGLADRRVSVPDRTSRLAERGVVVAGAVCAIVGIVVFVGTLGSPVSWAGDRWDDLKGGHNPHNFSGSRLSGDLGSYRYDFWRVGISDEFASKPVQGNGTDSFAITYARERRSYEEPLYPHSLPIQILAGTGLIGGLLFGGFLGFAIAAALRTRRAGPSFARATSAAALVTFAYWFLHASGDWLWAFGGLAGPAIAWLALAGRIEVEPRFDPRSVGPRPWRSAQVSTLAIVAVGLGITCVAALSYGLPWVAARNVEAANGSWRSDPNAAFDRLDWARRLNFFSSEPDAVAGSIANRLGERQRARVSFRRALDRQPDNWYTLLELGDAEAVAGDRQAGVSHLRRALELNPRDPLIRDALRRARAGRPLSPDQLDRVLLQRLCSTVGRTHDTRFCH